MLASRAEEESGGNSRFAGGSHAIRVESVDDLKRVTELTEKEKEIANERFRH